MNSSRANRQGWTRAQRLRSSNDFKAVFADGQWQMNDHLRAVVRLNGLGSSRVGIAVSKKFGNAVQRNVIKRRMREAARQGWSQLPVGLDVILMPSNRCPDPQFEDLARELPRVLEKAKQRLSRRTKKGKRPGHVRR